MSILSIQSHVSYGHVGNAAAVFPLQRLGFEVWPVFTTQFSNHLGYDTWTGEVFATDHVEQVIRGMEAQGIFPNCAAILSGFIGKPELGGVILDAVDRIRAANPDALYACDPVMGDIEEGLYVASGIPEFMRDRALAAADLISPNKFELQLLTGSQIYSLEQAVGAARSLVNRGPRAVMVTSLHHDATAEGTVEVLAVTAEGAWRVVSPLIPVEPIPKGCGDVITALFLGEILRGQEVPQALQGAVAGTYAVVKATAESGERELRLIAAQDALLAPEKTFPVQELN